MTVAPDSVSARRLAPLLQLASPMLPVGAYAYSQGIERAVHDALITDAASAQRWIDDVLAGPMTRFEAPLWLRLYRAALARDAHGFAAWNQRFVASRETFELRAETVQMGGSLKLLARELGLDAAVAALEIDEPSFPAAFAACAVALEVAEADGLCAYLWSWLENQVAAALKAVPLGQVAGQRILHAAQAGLDRALATACVLDDDELASTAPGLALTSALHETQYSRLFRS